MSVLAPLGAAAVALSGTLVGALLGRRSSRESNALVERQVEVAMKSLEREHARFVTQTANELRALRSEYVERPILERTRSELQELEELTAILFRIKAEALVAGQVCDRTDAERLLRDPPPPRTIELPVLSGLSSHYGQLPGDLGNLLLTLAGNIQRYNDLAAMDSADTDTLWRACAELERGFNDASRLATRSLEGSVLARERTRGELASQLRLVGRMFDDRARELADPEQAEDA